MDDQLVAAKEFFRKMAERHRNNGMGVTAALIARWVNDGVMLTSFDRSDLTLALVEERARQDGHERGVVLARANHSLGFTIVAALNMRK